METVAAGVFLAFVGLGAVYLSWDYGIGTALEPGSGYFPLVLGVLLTGLALTVAVRAWRARSTEVAAGSWPVRQLVCLIGALVAFAVLVGGIRAIGYRGAGFVPALFVLVLLSGLSQRGARLRENLLLAAVLTAVSLGIFTGLFGMALPLWPWSY